jgi:hypothetical protein
MLPQVIKLKEVMLDITRDKAKPPIAFACKLCPISTSSLLQILQDRQP